MNSIPKVSYQGVRAAAADPVTSLCCDQEWADDDANVHY